MKVEFSAVALSMPTTIVFIDDFISENVEFSNAPYSALVMSARPSRCLWKHLGIDHKTLVYGEYRNEAFKCGFMSACAVLLQFPVRHVGPARWRGEVSADWLSTH